MPNCQVAHSYMQSLVRRGAVLAMALSFICYGMTPTAQAAPKQLDPRASAFLEAFKAYEAAQERPRRRGRRSMSDEIDPESPLAPYFAQPFTDGLNPDDRARALDAQKRGDCRRAVFFLEHGFFNLYPFLRPAFEQKHSLALRFWTRVAKRHAPGFRRCAAYEDLKHARAALARRWRTPDIVDSTRLLAVHRPHSSDDPDQSRWCYGIWQLYDLAISRDFGPAQQDLLTFITTPRKLILPFATEYYLLERARQRGFTFAATPARHAPIRPALPTPARQRIARVAQTGNAGLARLPRWDCPVSLPSHLLLTAAEAAAPPRDPRARAFWAALGQQKPGSWIPFRYNVNPEEAWAPYVSEPFTKGLNPADRARLLEAEERGDCGAVYALLKQGFYNLYPFLKPVIERSIRIQSMLVGRMGRPNRSSLNRCIAYKRLNHARFKLERRWRIPDVVDARHLQYDKRRRPPDDPSQRLWCNGIERLYDLAVSDDVVTAQRDLLKFLAQPNRLILLPAIEFYLLERARHRDLKVVGAQARYLKLRTTLPKKVQHRIAAAAETGDIAMAQLPIWSCPFVRFKLYR